MAKGGSAAEVAGGAGVVVDPADPDAVASGLREALEHRRELRGAALERVAGLTWERCAQRIEEVWEELA
jgi:glycosyltransferase involved in cell wall biosynthesis